MSWPVLPHGFLGSQAATGDQDTYRIERSLRFNSADSAYLSRTPASSTNRKTFTWSGWYKRSVLGSQVIFGAGIGTSYCALFTTSSDTLEFQHRDSAVNQADLITTQVFRDVSSWYHIIVSVDTSQATSSNRVKIYVNGEQVTAFSTATYFTQNYDNLHINVSTSIHYIGYLPTNYLNGYLTEINFIDGQALTQSSFGETDALTGRWKAKAYSGTYGTNGFYLKFSDNSGTTATTLGKDSSGNGNNWTPNNFSVTAGAGNDSLVDSPTNYGTDTGVGGEVRGNYCTLNPLAKGSAITLANGNLDLTQTSTWNGVIGTMAVSSGKWYWELTYGGGTACVVGVATNSYDISTEAGIASTAWRYRSDDGTKRNGGAGSSSYGATWTTNDVIGIALNMDSGEITFYKNNASQGVAYSNLSGNTVFPVVGIFGSSGATSLNFGQRPFAYTAPSGFKALCTTNLPTPTIRKPSSYMDVVTYTGNGSSQTISSLGFSPDLLIHKQRSAAGNNVVYDTVRGSNYLITNSTNAEVPSSVIGLTSNGFSVGLGTDINVNGNTYVAWAWDAGETSSTNTAGSITSTVRVNALAGISVVGYTGNGTASTVGHGLGKTPSLIIVKCRNQSVATNWVVWSNSFSSLTNNYLLLNGISAVGTISNYWGTSAPTSSVFSVAGGGYDNNHSGFTHIAYLFAEVEGFSKFGSYTGNGSADGPFVWCGFRPRYLMIKSSSNTSLWVTLDTARDTFNPVGYELYPNSSGADGNAASSGGDFDYLSNGFKSRRATTELNTNGYTYIFAAFAESPFKYARAR